MAFQLRMQLVVLKHDVKTLTTVEAGEDIQLINYNLLDCH